MNWAVQAKYKNYSLAISKDDRGGSIVSWINIIDNNVAESINCVSLSMSQLNSDIVVTCITQEAN